MSVIKTRLVYIRIRMLNVSPPLNDANMSSITCKGYCSTAHTGFIVTLKYPHVRTEPSFSITGTMGVAHSECVTGDKTPVCMRRSSCCEALSRKAYESVLALQNFRMTPFFRQMRAGGPFNNPSSDVKRSLYSCKTLATPSLYTELCPGVPDKPKTVSPCLLNCCVKSRLHNLGP